LINRLLILGLILMVAGMVAVPAFAQLLPQGEAAVTDPVAGGGSVPDDVSSTEPGPTEDDVLPTAAANNPTTPGGSAADVIPVELSDGLCAEVTDPLVVGTFEQVLPEVVQGCLGRAPVPAGTAPVEPAPVEPAPVEPATVEPAPVDPMPSV
jgi:hypothetical protein